MKKILIVFLILAIAVACDDGGSISFENENSTLFAFMEKQRQTFAQSQFNNFANESSGFLFNRREDCGQKSVFEIDAVTDEYGEYDGTACVYEPESGYFAFNAYVYKGNYIYFVTVAMFEYPQNRTYRLNNMEAQLSFHVYYSENGKSFDQVISFYSVEGEVNINVNSGFKEATFNNIVLWDLEYQIPAMTMSSTITCCDVTILE